jgi:dTDP-4-dehydrorhamnose reductase
LLPLPRAGNFSRITHAAKNKTTVKKVMITGAGGMLGTSIGQHLKNVKLHALSSMELDITCAQQLTRMIYRLQPDYIINCDAYTAVDLAETNQKTEYKINSSTVEKLAQIAAAHQATIIHFSTDYFFDGIPSIPYKPKYPVNPINVYGSSKFLGEEAIKRSLANHYIFRTSWLYAPHGKNFSRWVLENELETMKIVDNQIRSLTSKLDVAQFIKHVIDKDPKQYGIYHFTNAGSMSWYAFAKAILEKSKLQEKIDPTSDFPTVAKRPEYSVMDCSQTQKVFNYQIKSIEEALDTVLSLYKKAW